ncbi:anthranilate synthase component I family protein [Tunturiibacter gelidoferens]|uniref:Anthranilate synthase component 1 n=2 Tax=Tunturiibacter TaxID=3154218 RepID=A0A7Y9NPV0_9BACT|nr:anthranilate synthase component I family protein [Edaphobacter lichenicola]MBB5341938.1 anthranilate synthase component 1 [Edaphobacter lichenicola]NYF53319.1 anthranilate synthase component 1 [Edaphobacter lichenicola]
MPSFDSSSLPSAREFLKLSRKHSLVPVYRTVTADLETPVSAFLRIASEEPEAFLLESVEGGEHVGRYTFIGIQPYKKMVARGTRITVREGRRESTFDGDIFEELKRALSGHTPARLPGLPPFTAGAVGFFAYDVVRQIEKLPTLAKDELGVPDACLMFFDQVLAFDHVKKEIHLMVTADLTREARDGAYERAVRRLNKMERRLAEALPVRKKKKPEGKLKITSRTPRLKFLKAVEKTKEYIASGDVFQCVLSQRFDCVPGVDAFEVYRALRIVNPSPYMYFLRFGLEGRTKDETQILHFAKDDNKKGKFADKGNSFAKDGGKKNQTVAHIVGSSPELLVRVHGREVEYRPIAGTRPRGVDEVKDRAMETDLRADEKEVAEHIMLVDLGRNDVGRVSEFGSVKVKDLMFVERYSHVMHMVSSLEGKLKAGLGALDAFRACFPAGTLSGAPKIRAMEIIEELEPARRGVYGGSVLYADFRGNLDSCIAIRTLYMNGEQGHFQAGAGIVADSVPEKEFEECGNKARAVMRAIERARGV